VPYLTGTLLINTGAAGTYLVVSGANASWTDALIDGSRLRIANAGAASVRVHEAYVDVTYVLRPVVVVDPIGA
jgi:hypothetical protein